MIDLARTVEEVGDSNGWDQPAILGITYQSGPREFAVAMFPVQPAQIAGEDGDVIGALMQIGNRMMRNTHEARRALAENDAVGMGDALAGLWLVQEVWMVERVVIGGLGNLDIGSVAEMPDRQEARQCMLVDCGGRLYVRQRIRGQKPTEKTYEPDDPNTQVTGDVPAAMRRILLAVGTNMSSGTINMEMLGKVGEL